MGGYYVERDGCKQIADEMKTEAGLVYRTKGRRGRRRRGDLWLCFLSKEGKREEWRASWEEEKKEEEEEEGRRGIGNLKGKLGKEGSRGR